MTALPREEILRLAHRHGVLSVRVFGSHARGTADDRSDVDLLVRMAPGRDLFDLVAFKRALTDLLQIPVDVISETGLSPYLRDRILGEAVPL